MLLCHICLKRQTIFSKIDIRQIEVLLANYWVWRVALANPDYSTILLCQLVVLGNLALQAASWWLHLTTRWEAQNVATLEFDILYHLVDTNCCLLAQTLLTPCDKQAYLFSRISHVFEFLNNQSHVSDDTVQEGAGYCYIWWANKPLLDPRQSILSHHNNCWTAAKFRQLCRWHLHKGESQKRQPHWVDCVEHNCNVTNSGCLEV